MKINITRLILFSAICSSCAVNSQACMHPSLQVGSCVTLDKCLSRDEEFSILVKTRSIAADFPPSWRNLICGFDGENFLICCINRGVKELQASDTKRSSLKFKPVSKSQAYPVWMPSPESLRFVPLHRKEGQEMVITTPSLNHLHNQYDKAWSSTTLHNRNFASKPDIPSTTYKPAQTSSTQRITRSTCGIARGKINRVVGGTEAKIGSYPWMAAMGFKDEYDGKVSFLSAGTLVTRRFVVTAAHCIKPSLSFVRLGAHNLSDTSEPNAINIRIKRTLPHEKFDLKSITNDIALIELVTEAPETKFIDVICLPEGGDFGTQDFIGMNPFLTGWGATKFRGNSEAVLRVAQVPIVNRSICVESYKTVSNALKIDERIICAGSLTTDACQGDSGGPLMLPKFDGLIYRYYLLGIVSYGRECTRAGFPGVYTRVTSYISWIKRHL